MIITCPRCQKQFEIDATLIPKEGRELQCGSCDHIWFYKIEKKIPEPIILKENVPNEETVFIEDNEIQPDENSEKTEIKDKPAKIKKTENNLVSKFFSYLIVFIISLVAVIILMDTFKKPIIDIFPGLEMILFNLYETLKDIKLFIIDLS